MKPLYQLTTEWRNVLDAVYDQTADGDGSIPPDQAAVLEGIEQDVVAKVAGCCGVIRDLGAAAEACRAEAARLNARAQAIDRRRQHLKEYVKGNLESLGMTTLKAGVFSVAIQRSPDAVALDADFDINKIPTRYVVIERRADKASIRSALLVGEQIPGARLTQSTHLRIR